MLKIIKSRKRKVLSYDGLIASLHILTFPSKFKDKNEQGVAAANKVNGHYFYYGIPGEEFFDIDIVQENNVMIEDDSTPFSLSRDEEEKDEIYQAFEESEENDQMTYSSKLTRNGSSIVEKCNFQNSLHTKFIKNQERSEKPKKAKKIKTDRKNNNNETASSKKINYVDEIEKLGNNGPSRLNLYCIRPERDPSSSSSYALTGNINVEVIKEFTDPTGVFILIESNFNPPNRSSKN
jgi:hypothetical protein